MTTSQMKYFIETARCLSFTQAAEHLYLSQPALSRHIALLEHELNTQLFVRKNNTVALTPAGKTLLSGLETIYGCYLDLLDQVSLAGSGSSGSLRIGFLEEQMIPPPVRRVLNELSVRYPNIRLTLSNATFRTLVDDLYNGSLDVIITLSHDIRELPSLDFFEFQQDSICLVVPKDHPLAGLESIRLAEHREEINRQTFILMSPDDSKPSTELTRRDFRDLNLSPTIHYAATAGQLALQVLAGMGLAFVNTEHILYHNPDVTFLPVLDIPAIGTAAAWKKGTENPSLALFMDLLQAEAEKDRFPD